MNDVEIIRRALSEALAALERMRKVAEREWVDVNDRLPDLTETYKGSPKKADVLVFTGNYVCEGRLEETYAKRKLTWKGAFDRCITVTHWMPLPKSPAALDTGQSTARRAGEEKR